MSDVFSPYPGLRPFYSDEAHLFFGREEQTDELLRRLHENRFLAVVGPSGCGKSSLVRAGMVPALESGFMTRAGSRWVFAVMRPGSHPMHRLALSLTKDARLGDGKDDESAAGLLGATLRRGPLGLLEALRERPLSAGTNLLVLVDQFEEVFRFHSEGGSDEADAFVALLLESARQREQQIYVVLTMRSDFFGECAVFSGLPEMLNESQYLTPRLTREQRRAAITGPARVFGGDVAPDLINRLLNEMGSDPDQLPLMQHLLMRMWTWHPNSAGTEPEGGEPRRLTLTDYEAVGGLRHALSNHASEAFEKLSPAQQSVAEILFRRLSERQPGSRDIRRPTPAGEVAELARASIKELTDVVDVFRAPGCSFVVPPLPEPIDAHSMLDISHEALIRQWDRLREWGEQEAQSAEQYKFLEQNAQLWKQGRMALWGTPNLEVALDWRERTRPTSLWAKRYGGDFELAAAFLDASARAREAHETALKEQRQRQVRRLQRMIAASVVLAMLLGGALGSAYWVLFQEHASYYRYFTKHWGEPVGYGSLTAEQVQHRDFSLKFVRRGIHTGFRWRELFDVGFWTGNGESHPVVRIEAVNSRDECTPVNSIATYIEPDQEGYTPLHECRFLFVRDDTTGRMVYEKAYDKNGNLRWGFA
ncbi:MAG: ATP-binding protein, partial [Acetobacteraceae bacterium]|nr:ATP-binding protein [Acetobacteraceae bacterium]